MSVIALCCAAVVNPIKHLLKIKMRWVVAFAVKRTIS